jgi:hypothetical protein
MSSFDDRDRPRLLQTLVEELNLVEIAGIADAGSDDLDAAVHELDSRSVINPVSLLAPRSLATRLT